MLRPIPWTVDTEPTWGDWGDWGPAALRGLQAGAIAATPVAALDALLRLAARRLAGRRFTVPGTGLTLRVEALKVRPNPMGLTVGQFDDIRLAARDLEWRGWSCTRLVVVCRNVHLRPLPTPAVVSAPVEVEVALLPAVVRDRVAQLRPEVLAEVGPDGEARLRWARRPRWGAVVVTVEVAGPGLDLRPVGMRLACRYIPLPGWLPPVRMPVPAPPRGLRLRDVVVGPEEIVLTLVADQWREGIPHQRLADLLAGLDRLG